MTESKTEYENLKRNIIGIYQGSLDIKKVKEHFSNVINSRRSISKIKDLNDIFHLLEQRDVLDCNNVSAFVHLENLVRNEEVFNLIRGYKKLYLDSDCRVCNCGEDLTFSFPILNPDRSNSSESQSYNLESAFQNIAVQIKKNWCVLARELNIPECYIDQIREKYPFDFYQQALKIFKIWKETNEETATMDVLKKALESRLCKNKGLGIHMLKPVVTVK